VTRSVLAFAAFGLSVGAGRTADAPFAADLAAVAAVGPGGAGNAAAAAAWKKLAASGEAALVPTLTAFDSAGPAAANWLRSAVDAIVEGEAKAGRKLPAGVLTAFVNDTKRAPAARRIAFELLAAQDKTAADSLLPALVNDPSLELRRDAIADRLAKAKELAPEARVAAFRILFAVARDKDQIAELADLLDKAGEKPDVTRHYGFVTEWLVAGPFPSPDGAGFAKPYPPEAGVDPAASYGEAKWKPAQSDAKLGTIDLNREVGKLHDAAAYAYAVVVADQETPAELRATGKNSIQIFLNGTKLYEKDEYHHGTYLDQHPARGTLKAGRNEILVKVLQNNQTENWAQDWTFALRVCDATGGAIPIKQVVTRNGKTETILPGALKPAAKKEAAK
jgi:hypothetical protein